MFSNLKEILLDEQTLDQRVSEIAQELTQEYKGKDALFIAVLNGSFMFCSDLLKKLDFPLELNFVKVSSYGNSMHSSGKITISEHNWDLKGRDVVIIEDIIDSGRTLSQLAEYFKTLGVKSIKTVVLLDKKERRVVPFEADYVGFEIEDKFVVGYGLDYAQYYRNMPYIAVIDETKL